MIIVWGTMLAGIRRGWVGDYCPVCRTCTAFRAKQMRAIPHLMFIPLWVGTPVAWHCRCATCRIRIARPGRFYLRSVRQRADPGDLVQQTNPDGADDITRAIDREMRIDEGTAVIDEMIESAADSMALLSLEVLLQTDRGRTRSVSSLIAVGFIIAATVAFGFAAAGSLWVWPVGAIAAAALVALVYHTIIAARRSKERLVGQLLARVSARGACDQAFVEQVLAQLTRSGVDWAVGLKAPTVGDAACRWFDQTSRIGADSRLAA